MSVSQHEPLVVDFAGLAAGDDDFGKIFSANDGYVDFQDAETVQYVFFVEFCKE